MLPQTNGNEALGTGAIREMNDGKGRFDLIEPELLFRLALHSEFGAKKYSERNWEKGIPASRCLNSAFRHLVKYQAGWDDEDHLTAVVWNLSAIMRWEKDKRKDMLDLPRYKGGNDGYSRVTKGL